MRARSIKPGFFTNEDLADVGPLGMLLFEGLWCMADREGRLEDRPRQIRAQVLPYFEADANQLLGALASRGFIVRYQAGSRRFIQIVNWLKHQNPHHMEQPSEIPAPSGADSLVAAGEEKPSTAISESEHDSLTNSDRPDNDGSTLRAPDQETRNKKQETEIRQYLPGFETFWTEYPHRAGTNSKRDAFKNWKARMWEGAAEAELLEAVRRYRAFCEATGKVGTETVMQAVRFLGPGEHWKQPWTLPAARAAPSGLGPMSAAKRDLLEDIKQTRERENNSAGVGDDGSGRQTDPGPGQRRLLPAAD